MLTDRLEKFAATIEAAIKRPLTIVELVDVVRTLGDVITDYNPSATFDENLKMLTEAWDWADQRFQLVDKADDAIKLPVLLEAFDGPLIRWIVPNAILPPIAKAITKKA
jgi:hypothetical protein